MATHSIADIEAQIKAHVEQIEQLKAAAAKQRADEIGAVVQDARAKIAEYGISAKELGLGGKETTRRAAAVATGPRYRGPDGEIWVGGTRGRKPRWLTEGLAAGKTLADFAA
ncbi:H-NS histone family protein [Variovorax boronicumulans]|uniref:H-NS histone family protein n=1 Tax=Variovorax boronicumulans TaxID=436515 RepID=UPI00277D99B0|nr:H-NS histone family protein [Variovorax boronicumulans]MDQ0044598.1 DNA-binding protein H-NS [Variovorax boronicumulans]